MKLKFIIALIFHCSLALSGVEALIKTANAQVNRIELNQNWKFKKAKKDEWKNAKVPGTVQEDLLRLEAIENPFIAQNEKEIEWIEKEDWIYKSNFKIPKNQLNKQIELHFEGLDTYASIYLNDELLLETNNLFRHWKLNLTGKLKAENQLRIYFYSPIKKGKKILKKLPYKLPAGNDVGKIKVSPVVRKAAFHFGWDWGPRIVTTGIWRPVYLLIYDENKIENVFTETKNINKEFAELSTNILLKNNPQNLSCKIYVDEQFIQEQKIKNLQEKLEFKILNPKLWQTNGLGKANLYEIKIEILKDGKIIDQQKHRIGLRKIELIHQPDSIGTSFYFKLNGKAIFIKGANYIPQSHFTNSLTEKDYRKILQAAADANMNMIRVWGGGIYEQDIFYEICDELGLLVWQDFMFANTMYPPDEAFLENIKAEVSDNILRLRQHPCIAHWNGNNEINVAWFNWGWQNQNGISSSDSAILYQNYQKIFQEIIPNQVQKLIPNSSYSHTSPLSNWGKAENFNHATMHYWGVFHGEESFAAYAKNVGRFNAEYGFQSFPDYRILEEIFGDEKPNFESKILDHRQKSYKGNRLIFKHLEEEFYPDPLNPPKGNNSLQKSPPSGGFRGLKNLCYLSQISQAYGISYAIQNHRIRQPHSMGTLYWQLNDCWPAISWSSLNYDGTWKALHYAVRENYNPQAIFIDTIGQNLEIILMNEKAGNEKYNLEIKLMDLEGKIYYKNEKTILLQNKNIVKDPVLEKIIQEKDKTNLLLFVQLKNENLELKKLHYFVSPKNLKLQKTQINYKIEQIEKEILIHIKTNKFAKNVCLRANLGGFFSDNYFDLLPNESRTISFETEEDWNDFENSFEILCLNDLLK